jgi:hypothetical protein
MTFTNYCKVCSQYFDKYCACTDPSKPAPAPEKRVRRELVWRGKHYPEGECGDCHKVGPLMVDTVKSPVNENATIKWHSCFRCIQIMADTFDKVAGELRAACAGGTYTEKELK